MAARHSGALVQSSSAVGLITVAKLSPQSFLEAGRAFERLWLEASLQGLSLQPLTGLVLLHLRMRLQEPDGLRLSQIEFLNSTRDYLARLFHLDTQVPAMMFRIGVGVPPSARTIRRQVAELLGEVR
jgi:nitroreductase